MNHVLECFDRKISSMTESKLRSLLGYLCLVYEGINVGEKTIYELFESVDAELLLLQEMIKMTNNKIREINELS